MEILARATFANKPLAAAVGKRLLVLIPFISRLPPSPHLSLAFTTRNDHIDETVPNTDPAICFSDVCQRPGIQVTL